MKLLCIIISILSLASLSASPYSMEDLKVLKKQKSYKEYLDHAHDIRPASRSKEWQKMTGEVAFAFVELQIKKLNHHPDTFRFIEKIANWPSLRDEEFFQIKRSVFAKDYLFSCFQQEPKSQTCLQQLRNFWQSSPKKAEDAFTLGTLLQQEFPKENHWDFFKELTKSDLGSIYCKRSAVEEAFLSHFISLEATNELSQKTILNIDKDINAPCWESLSARLKKRLQLQETSQITREALYQILDQKGSLKEKEKDLYSVLYILEGPIVGETFNKSWHTIRLLGENHARRKRVLDELEKYEILPGKVFDLADRDKSRVLSAFLSKNIPEYLNYYAKSCLNHLHSHSISLKRNPALYCKGLLSHAKELSILKPQLIKAIKSSNSAIK